MRTVTKAFAVGVAAVCLGGVAAQAFSVETVRGTRANEGYPAAGVDPATGATYVAWSQSRPGHRNQYDAYLQRRGRERIKLNTRGMAWTFGLDPATHQVAYQQARNGDSNIRLYDYATGLRNRLDPLVNTTAWEYAPSVSGQWLVFARLNYRATPDVRTLYLYNLTTHERRVLATYTGNYGRGVIDDGQVNGDWVVWAKVTHGWRDWSVYRYQISTGETTVVPRPAGRYDYVPSVAADGTMYFARSASSCGALATFRQYDLNGVVTNIGRLPVGYDAWNHSFISEPPDGSRQLYFDALRCAGRPSNVNVYMTDVTPAPAPPAARPMHQAAPGAEQAPWHPAWVDESGAIRP